VAQVQAPAFIDTDGDEIVVRPGDIFYVNIELESERVRVTSILDRLGRRFERPPISLETEEGDAADSEFSKPRTSLTRFECSPQEDPEQWAASCAAWPVRGRLVNFRFQNFAVSVALNVLPGDGFQPSKAST